MNATDVILSIVGFSVALGVSYWPARTAGLRYRSMKPWVAAATNVPGVALGVVICTYAAMYGSTPLWVTGLALMMGNLVGVRHGRTRADRQRTASLRAEREAAARAGESASGTEASGVATE